MGVGTATLTKTESRTMNKLAIDWTSSSSGAVPSTDSETISGEILRCVFVPDSSGTQPSNAYDVTLSDADGIDILAGNGANLSNTTALSIVPGEELLSGGSSGIRPFAVDGPLSLVVANAGDTKGGTINLYYR